MPPLMLFEFSIVKKYLIPQRKRLSLSLIALMSVVVISLVVWLVLIFLSVTEGIEKAWLKKLTTLNAPLQIIPTDAYYHSYYYQIDGVSSASDYQFHNLREKLKSGSKDPFSPEEDAELPSYFPSPVLNPDGSLKDFVHEAFSSIEKLRGKKKEIIAEDYEMSGALLKLQMIRNHHPSSLQDKGASYLTQVSYISSFSEKNPHLPSLLLPPRIEDLNHLFFLTNLSSSNNLEGYEGNLHLPSNLTSKEIFHKRVYPLLESLTIQKIKPTSTQWEIPPSLLPEGKIFNVYAFTKKGALSYLVFSKEGEAKGKKVLSPYYEVGILSRLKQKLIFTSQKGEKTEVSAATSLYLSDPPSMEATLISSSIKDAASLKELKFQVSFDVQGHKLSGEIPWKEIEIQEAKIETSFSSPPRYSPPWPYLIQNGKEKKICLPENNEQKVPAILPKSFQSNGLRLGDLGYFSYGAETTSAIQEQRLPLYVAGFYDPGIMAIGAKAILTSSEVVQTINSSSRFFAIDPLMSNGIHVWLEDLNDTKEVVRALKEEFQKTGLLSYFAIIPFYEYEFAKDLLFQFQSDKILFTIVGAIILMVACSNIISLLIILVNDKKKEIAILSAMGASKRRIALIFTLCGGIMGLLSTLLGSAFALLTLRHIDKVARFLSFIQGREAFNALFYGNSLPSELSSEALLFILIATPIISLLAGLIPAIRATHFHPSQILRSE